MKCPACGADNPETELSCCRCRAPLPGAGSRTILGGRFRVMRSLGQGGMGEIMLAEDVKLGRRVAIKRVSAAALCDGESKARFLREAQAASRLDHANICTIYEIAEEEGREHIVMQYVDGVTLDQLLKMKPLSVNQVVDIASQVADGMIAAQARHVVHRDIKPGNIMIDRDGRVKILDFGLAKICPAPGREEDDADGAAAERRDRDLTEKGIVLGTVSYMSPEQARGQKLDGRSDIFSFGVVLYEMLENRNPFSDEENIVTLYNILHREPRFVRPAPEALRAVIARCLQKERERRFRDFAEVRQALAALRDGVVPAPGTAANATEVIDAREHQEILRGAAEPRPDSDSERLSEMVSRLKRMKASTEALRTGGSRRAWRIAAAALLPAAALAAWLLLLRPALQRGGASQATPPDHVLLFPLENRTPDPRVGAEVDYLIAEALNGSPGFKALTAAELRVLSGGREVTAERLSELARRFGIRYVLRGKLGSVADKYDIEARLSRVGAGDDHAPFFIPGKGKDSLLTDQVDNLARRVRESVSGASAAGGATPLMAAFGSDWHAFDLFFQGKSFWDKRKFAPARRLLLSADSQAGGLPAARLHLALLADFSGDAGEAQARLRSLLPALANFSPPMRLRVQALKAKFDFDLAGQVRCLRELKAMFPFSKEQAFELGEAFFRHGDAERAIPEYEAALALDRDYAAALNHLGYCLSYLGRHRRAIECFERYRDIDRTANSFDSLGDGYFYLGDYTQAENSKIYAVSLDDAMDWPYQTLADIAILRADFQEAEKYLAIYQRLADFPKAQADALAKKAYIRFLEGAPAAALDLLREALQRHGSASINDHSGEYHWLSGLCRIALNDLPAARRELEWLRRLRGAFRLSADNFDAALKFCLHLEARIAEAAGRLNEADESYRELLAMKPQLSFWVTYYSYPFFENEYAGFLARRGDRPAARAAVDRCLAFNPDYAPALWTLADLLKADRAESRGEVLRRIEAVYGEGHGPNPLRDKLAAELK